MSFKSTVSKSIREAILSPALDAVVSSANMVSVEFSFKKQRSLMKMIKSSGPRMEPWGTPIVVDFLSDNEPSNLVTETLFER